MSYIYICIYKTHVLYIHIYIYIYVIGKSRPEPPDRYGQISIWRDPARRCKAAEVNCCKLSHWCQDSLGFEE